MSDDFDRRSFIRRTSMGAAAVGALSVAGSSVLGTSAANAATPTGTSAATSPAQEPVIDGSDVIAHVIDARTGEIAILAGDKEIKCVDRRLAQQLVRLAK